MRFVIQRVKHASVEVNSQTIGKIDNGLMVLCGIAQTDTTDVADKMVKKLCGLRIFPDEQGKTNLSVSDVSGKLLIISQFTLYADCKSGYRPGFSLAGKPDMAESLYEYVLKKAEEFIPGVEHGIFGADMKVDLLNDGPFTIILDSAELGY